MEAAHLKLSNAQRPGEKRALAIIAAKASKQDQGGFLQDIFRRR
jgi:hypothetical protein